jgi:hypothetical protein
MLKPEELNELQNKHSDGMISIIAPMNRIYPASDKNPIIFKNMLKEAEKKLTESYDPEKVSAIMEKLNAIESTLDFNHLLEGLAVYVSDDTSKIVHLPFTPAEKISVGSSFHTRDLHKACCMAPEYFFLLLSIDNVKLFRGEGAYLYEIKNHNFPMVYGGPERTEPLSKITRQDIDSEELGTMQQFLAKVDDNLFEMVHDDRTPLFVAGEAEYITFLKDRNKAGKYIKGYMHQNLANFNTDAIVEKVYPMVEEYVQMETSRLLHLLQESVGYNKAALGIYEVWRATKLGQVMTLIVEENYAQPAHVPTSNELDLKLLDTMPTGYRVNHFDDIVDEIIENVTMMGGTVQFVSDGQLQEQGRIGAILRYERIEADNENVIH